MLKIIAGTAVLIFTALVCGGFCGLLFCYANNAPGELAMYAMIGAVFWLALSVLLLIVTALMAENDIKWHRIARDLPRNYRGK